MMTIKYIIRLLDYQSPIDFASKIISTLILLLNYLIYQIIIYIFFIFFRACIYGNTHHSLRYSFLGLTSYLWPKSGGLGWAKQPRKTGSLIKQIEEEIHVSFRLKVSEIRTSFNPAGQGSSREETLTIITLHHQVLSLLRPLYFSQTCKKTLDIN